MSDAGMVLFAIGCVALGLWLGTRTPRRWREIEAEMARDRADYMELMRRHDAD